MQMRILPGKSGLLAAFISLLICVLAGCVEKPPAPKSLAQSQLKEAIESWQDAGAEIQWIEIDWESGAKFSSQPTGADGELPLFVLSVQNEEKVSELPDPGTPFMLDISDSGFSDAQLKEFVKLESLQGLFINSTEVTDLGLKELAELKSLKSLHLAHTRVTDVGLKELQKLLPDCEVNC